jgi:hypothetical protein
MTAPTASPAPAMNRTPAGIRAQASAIAAADIIVAVGDYTAGASEDMFTLAAHGLVDGDHLHLLWQSAMGVAIGGEATKFIVKYLSSSTFQLTTNGSTIVENAADGTAVFLKGRTQTPQVEQSIVPLIIVADGDFTGGAASYIFTPAQGTKGIYEADTLKLLYKAAAGVVLGIAVNATVYALGPTITYFQVAASAGGAVIQNSADGVAVFLKTS